MEPPVKMTDRKMDLSSDAASLSMKTELTLMNNGNEAPKRARCQHYEEEQPSSQVNDANTNSTSNSKKKAKPLLDPTPTASEENENDKDIAVTSLSRPSNDLDSLPPELIRDIHDYVGKGCYLRYGSATKRINQIFKLYELPKQTCYGGYTSFEKISQRFELELYEINMTTFFGLVHTKYFRGMDYYELWKILPEICRHIATGIVSYNRKDLFELAMRKKNKYLQIGICYLAAYHGKIEILKQVLGSLDEELLRTIRSSSRLCERAAKNRNIETLEFLHNNGCQWNSKVTRVAAWNKDLECLKYLHEKGCEMGPEVFSAFALKGELEILKYLHEQGCPWCPSTFSGAARSGNLDCLRFLHKHGCPWDSLSCRAAAMNGHFDCLRYLHEQGCPWDDYTFLGTAENGHFDCLRYLHEQGCPCDDQASGFAAGNGHIECMEYLIKHGCKFNTCLAYALATG